MSYEINEVIIIDDSRQIVNAGVVTATRFAGDGSTLTNINSDQIAFTGNTLDPDVLQVGSSIQLAGGNIITEIADEDDLASNSDTKLVTQQSVKAYIDGQIATDMWLFSNQAAFPSASSNHGRVVHSHADGVQFYAHGGQWIQLANNSQIVALQADVDQNESDGDAADVALSNRLDALEADPTTQALLTAEAATRASADASETSARQVADNALSARITSLEADPTTQTLLDAEAATRAADDNTLTGLISALTTTVSNLASDVDQNEADADQDAADLATLTGVSLGSTTLGTFTGNTISDNNDIKEALQDLENGVDNALGGGAAAASVKVESTSLNAAHYLTFVNADNVSGVQENVFTDAGVQYNPSSNILTVGEVIITGDLTVNGSQTVIDTTSITTQDKNITLGVSSTASDATADGGGFTLQGTTDKTFKWLASTNALTSSEHIDLATGKAYYIDNASVLSKTTLGASVVNSSLTSVGTLTDLTVTGAADLNGNLDVDGFTQLDGLNVDGSTTLDAVQIDGALDLNAGLDVDGFTQLDGLNVDGATTMDALTVAGDLNHGSGDIIGDGSTNISGINTVTASGKMYALSYTTTSDAALKENVEKIEGAVEKVEAIRGVTFDWKSGEGSSAGVIAQEIESVMPMLVESGDHKRVDYNGLVGLLIEAVKELSAEVKELKSK